MRPLTATTPKPLLKVAETTLLDRVLDSLANAGVEQAVINLHWLPEQVRKHCSQREDQGKAPKILFSEEPELLETAGGIREALPLLGDAAFIVSNADVYCELDYQQLNLPEGMLAHLVLVDNPEHHPEGDFYLARDGRIVESDWKQGDSGKLTWAGISIFHPDLFDGLAQGKQKLKPLLDKAIAAGRVSGEHFRGRWVDVGTPARLAALSSELSDQEIDC